MGRPKGEWTRCYHEVWSHPKTQRAVDELLKAWPDIDDFHWLHTVARQIVVSGVLQLSTHLLHQHSTNGVFKVPRPAKFLKITWPDYEPEVVGVEQAEAGACLLRALVEARFIDHVGSKLRLHDYELFVSRVPKAPAARVSTMSPGPTTERPSSTGESSYQVPSEPSGRQSPSDVSGSGESGPAPLQALNDLWRDVRERLGTKWVAHPRIPAAAIDMAHARWREEPNRDVWLIALEAAARDEHWSGRKPNDRYPDGWAATWVSFLRETHFHRWVTAAKDQDWRYAADKDAAWDRWLEGLDGRLPQRYTGASPWDGMLTPGQQDEALAKLRQWWELVIYTEGR